MRACENAPMMASLQDWLISFFSMALYVRSVTKNRHDRAFLLYLCLRAALWHLAG
jgi:hypothetical protein